MKRFKCGICEREIDVDYRGRVRIHRFNIMKPMVVDVHIDRPFRERFPTLQSIAAHHRTIGELIRAGEL